MKAEGVAPGGSSRRWWRALTVAVILLVGTELALQAGHWYAVREAGRSGITDPGAPVIICVGDSHTFGVGVPEGEAYPARLEQKIRESGRRVNVVNLGVPGMNTSEIRRRLPEQLKIYRPVAVVVLAGVNDGWNRRDVWWSDREDGLESPLMTRTWGWLTSKVMIARALQVLVHRLDWTRPVEETSQDREGRLVLHRREESWKLESARASYDRARRNLIAVVNDCRAARAVPIFMTYVTDPEFTFDAPNQVLRETSVRTRSLLADNDKYFHDIIYKNGKLDPSARERYFFPDMHPSSDGYDLISAHLFESLQEAGILDFLPR